MAAQGIGLEAQPLTSEYLHDLFYADAEPERFLRALPEIPRWNQLDPKPPVAWATDDGSCEYHHQTASISYEPFSLTVNVIARLAELNHFQVDSSNLLFGLRGCVLADQVPFVDFSSRISVREAIPDHQDFRCVIGVANRASGQLWAAGASTVPNVDYIYQCWKGGVNANLLPTGLHLYEVGPHNRGKPSAMQPGAFRQVKPVCVLRTKDDMTYQLPKDQWDFTRNVVVADNIHAGVLDRLGTLPRFSSAGCQTLPGAYDIERTTPLGVWARFRAAAGLAPVPTITNPDTGDSLEDGRRFQYMLLTGREARVIAQDPLSLSMRRLRYGSSGPLVYSIQLAVGAMPSALFDQQTMIALINYQLRVGMFPDGIVTPGTADSIGVNL